MKYSAKRAFALIIALLLSLPSVCAEPVALDDGIVIVDEAPDISDGPGLVLDGDAFAIEDFDGLLSDGANGLALDGLVSNLADAAPAAPVPFEQTVRAGDAAFTVSAEAGAFPEGASLRVSDILDETLSRAATDAAEAVLPDGVKQHRLYQIEVIDRDGNLCPMNGEMALPSVRVEGLDVGEAARMVFYDPAEKQGREIEIEREREKVIRFGFAGSGVYDVVEIVEDMSIPTDVFTSGDVDTADESDVDGQQPSPVGEGGMSTLDNVPSLDDSDTTAESDADDQLSPSGEGVTAQSTVTDEAGSPSDGDTVGDMDLDDDQQPSPVGGPSARESVQWTDSSEDGSEDPRNGAEQSEADEVPSPDDASTSTDGDTAIDRQEQPTDDQQAQSSDEGTSSGADAPPSPEGKAFGEQPADDESDTDDTSTPDDQTDEQSTDGDTSDAPIGLQPVSPDGEPASPQEEASGSDDTSTLTDGDTADESNIDDPQKPSPDGEGGAAQSAVTDEVPSPDDGDTADESNIDDSQKPSPDGEGGAAQSAVTDEVPSPDDGDISDESNIDDPQKPSPDGEGGAVQSTVTDEVPSPDDPSTPTNGDTADESSPDDQKPSPDGEGGAAQSAVTDEVSSPDDPSTPTNGDTSDGSSPDDPQKPSPDGEGGAAQSAVTDEVPSPDDPSTPTNGDTADESSPDDQKPSPDGEGGAAQSAVTDEVSSPDDPSTPTDGDTASDQQGQPTSDTPSPDIETDPIEETPDDTPASSDDPALPVPFDQTASVNGVAVTVRAPAGAFPANALLSVKRVPSYKVRQAGAAIDEIREEDQNVAVSYTFDIKVIDSGTKAELQPAEGCGVEVSFALSEANDENLEANVYHITNENGAMTAEKLDTGVDESAETVTASSDGFSYYTVEFTYPDLEYLMQGGASVALSEILAALDLTGEPTSVVSSDDSLLSVTQGSGSAWTVDSLGVFSGALTLTVTIGGVDYPITVTCYQKNLYYRDADGTVRKLEAWTPMSGDSSDSPTWRASGGKNWLVAMGNITIEHRVTVEDSINLILCDGCELVVKEGIAAASYSHLNIYGGALSAGQIEDSGRLYAGTTDGHDRTCQADAAGIGGGTGAGGGYITINGGSVYAIGEGDGAGIGGGAGGRGGTITINGGSVYAIGEGGGAGIGGGKSGSGGSISINGGRIVLAKGGVETSITTGEAIAGGAGIGSGSGKSEGNITINGGTIEYACGGGDGAGIGGGRGGSVNRITINGGAITAEGDVGGAGIGGGAGGSGGAITVKGGEIYTSSVLGAGIGGGENSDGGTIRINGGKIFATGKGGAGIGGGKSGSGGTITIAGGYIRATNDRNVDGGAGIGGGAGGSGGAITVKGGEIHASGIAGAGIGGGEAVNVSGAISVAGGVVYASSTQGAGIGSGLNSYGCDTITVAGGEVHAESTSGAGIGGGEESIGGTIKITGGEVSASSDEGDCVGAGYEGYDHGTLTLGQVKVTANGTDYEKNEREGVCWQSGTVKLETCQHTGGTPCAFCGYGSGGATVYYKDGNANKQLSGFYTSVTDATVTWASGWYVVNGSVTISSRVEAIGEVNLILCDGCTLNANDGIHVGPGSALSIYVGNANGTIAGNGKLQVNKPKLYLAGIGGDKGEDCGTVNITGGTVTVEGGNLAAGIGGGYESDGGNITISGGTVEAVSTSQGAGIGGGCNGNGGNITITGGTITATGSTEAAGIGGGKGGSGGVITITGGTIANAKGGQYAAGIGGGNDRDGGVITITGGTINAEGSERGAGIGGGRNSSGGNITITGCVAITATGGQYSAGIGCGWCGSGGNITITGGNNITATGSTSGAGIGDGTASSGGTVTITGGNITATGGGNGTAGISARGGTIAISGGVVAASGSSSGAGIDARDGTIAISGGTINAQGSNSHAGIDGSKVAIIGGTVTAEASDSAAAIKNAAETLTLGHMKVSKDRAHSQFVNANNGGRESACNTSYAYIVPCAPHDGKPCAYCGYGGGNIRYLDDSGALRERQTCTWIDSAWVATPWKDGEWYAVTDNATIAERVEVKGDVHLILCDGYALTAAKGIHVPENASLTVYAGNVGETVAGTGALKANASDVDFVAGIGGSNGETCGAITIIGGIVTAIGGRDGAGIGGGGGNKGNGKNITISGGEVNATGGDSGAGIGGGVKGKGENITVNGGTVTARGGRYAAGIGGGSDGSGENITVNGGMVTATGGDSGAGIGGGGGGSGSYITISDGTVTAIGGEYGAGIGSGNSRNGGNITITGGTVTATGGDYGAGIGGGDGGSGSYITISDGTVTAIGNGGGMAVGKGNAGDSGSLTVGDGMKAAVGDSRSAAKLQLYADRANACLNSAYAHIESCAYGDHVFEGNPSACKYCGEANGTISIDAPAGSCDAEVSVEGGAYVPVASAYAEKGEAVALKVTAKSGWVLVSVGMQSADGTKALLAPGGDGAYRFVMPGRDVTVKVKAITEWQALQNQIDAAANAADTDKKTVVLAKRTTANSAAGDKALIIPDGKAVTVDLNGFTLDRGLDSAVDGGNVITVPAGCTLTVTDASANKAGRITGGYNTGNGGGVYIEGTFNFEGGAITGNRASAGGGAYVAGRGAFHVAGPANITGNKSGASDSNVHLCDGKTVGITGALADGARIGVTTAYEAGTDFTSNYGRFNGSDAPSKFFTSDDGTLSVGWNDGATEAMLGKVMTVTASGYDGIYDGKAHGIRVQVTEPASGAQLAYSLDGASYSSQAPEFTAVCQQTPVYWRVTARGYFPRNGVETVTIAPKAVTVTADAKKKTYGEADPALTYKVTGLAAGESLSGNLVRDAGEDVGTYDIRQGTLKATDNYALTFNGAKFTIERKAVNVTADAKSKTYGDKDPALTYVVDGLLDGDKLTGELVRDAGENVGSYDITQGTLKASGNYAVTFTGAKLTIDKKAVTVTADAKSKTYGDVDPALTYVVDGLLDGDKLTGELVRDAGEDVGSYDIKQGTLKATDNYALTFTGAKLTIGKKAVTITADAKSKTYGDKDPALTYKATGLLKGDRLTGKLVRKASEDVGSYEIKQGTLKASGNYTMTFKGAKLTIKRAAVTVAAVDKSKTYGGKDPKLTAKVSGLKNGDKASAIKYTLNREAGENVGEYAITAKGKAKQGNYAVTFKGATFKIKRAAVTVAAVAASKTYGDKDPKLTAKVSGLKNGDVASAIKYTLTREAGENVGEYAITAKGKAKQGNYTVTFKGATFKIKRAAVTVAAVDKSKTYGGKDPKLTAKVSGLKNGDKASVISYTLTRAKGRSVGSYAITAKGKAVQGNYTVTYRGAKLTIKPRPLTVVAKAKTKKQGEADPKLTYTVKGLLKGDKLTGKLSRKPGETPGKYAITQGTLKASRNYKLIFKGAVLTIVGDPAKPDLTERASVETVGDDAVVLAWTEVNGAYKYDVFFKACDSGKGYTLAESTKALSCEIKGLKKETSYKAYVRAWKPKGKKKDYIGDPSPMLHFIAGGYSDEFCNPKEVTVKRSNITLRKGRTGVIEASVVGVRSDRPILDHEEPLRYYSSDTKVAQVLGSGLFKAVGKGTCEIIVMAVNGVNAKVRVRVK